MCLCQCMFECVASFIEFLSKFALIEACFTGLGFWDAGKQVTSLLKRHFVQAYTVWWVPPLVLHTFGFVLAATFGVTVGFMSGGAFKGKGDSDDLVVTERCVMGVLAFFAALIVIGFFTSL